MTVLYEWGHKWGIPAEALEDFRTLLRSDGNVPENPGHKGSEILTESGASNMLRLAYAKNEHILWRNNVGQVDPVSYAGQFIRFGLCNDSKRLNQHIKSSDLIGITQVRITSKHVGSVIGQFTAREMKKPNWRFTGTAREKAQERYLKLVVAMGGDGKFSTGS